MFKYVLIDIDDTIIDFYKSSEDSLRKMFALKGYPFKEDTMEIYHKVNLPLWKQVTEGKMTVDELRLYVENMPEGVVVVVEFEEESDGKGTK